MTGERRRLLERVVDAQLRALADPTAAQVRAALREARAAVREHDAETVARFEVAIRKEAAE